MTTTFPDDDLDPIRREMERMWRWYDMVNPPILRMREQERLAAVMNPVALESQRMLAEIATSEAFATVTQMAQEREKLLAAVLRMEQAARSLAQPPDQIRRQIVEATRAAAEMYRPIADFAREAAALASVADEQLRIMEMAGATFHQRLLEFEAAETLEEQQEGLAPVLSALVEWVRTLPVSALSVGAVKKIVYYIFFAVLPIHTLVSSHRFQHAEENRWTEETIRDEETEALIDHLRSAIEQLTPEDRQGPMYRSTKELILRVAPHRQARETRRIPVGVLLEQMENQGQWLNVVFLDLETGLPVSGWVYNRGMVLAGAAEKDGREPGSVDDGSPADDEAGGSHGPEGRR